MINHKLTFEIVALKNMTFFVVNLVKSKKTLRDEKMYEIFNEPLKKLLLLACGILSQE